MNSGLSSGEVACVCSVLKEVPSVQEVILFGSRAKGGFRAGSDVDLAVKGCSDSDVVLLSAALNEETVLPYFFDVIAYEKINSPELLEHIERVGVTIYSTSSEEKGIHEVSTQRKGAWERARAAGVDVSLLESNLRLTISERLRRHDAALNTILKLRGASGTPHDS